MAYMSVIQCSVPKPLRINPMVTNIMLIDRDTIKFEEATKDFPKNLKNHRKLFSPTIADLHGVTLGDIDTDRNQELLRGIEE